MHERSGALLSFDPANKKLTVRGAHEFPTEVFDYADKLEILDMSHGHLSSMPDDLSRLASLKTAFFSHNDFEEVPRGISSLAGLTMLGMASCGISNLPDGALPAGIGALILTDNRLERLPEGLGKMSRLRKLSLAGNALEELPRTLEGLRELELVRLSGNHMPAAPEWLLEMPNLAWYCDAGNAFSLRRQENPAAAADIPWADLEIRETLSENAKSVVYRAKLGTSDREVAVKVWTRETSADGDFRDEIDANILAGPHPNLIGVVGRLTGVPDGKEGLVMTLAGEAFRLVGSIPDYQSLTRDVYPAGVGYSLGAITRILSGTAAAMRHLHKAGIMHGDLYGHNILADARGDCLLGDMGAASLYERSGVSVREHIDVKAFGHLVGELLTGSLDKKKEDEQVIRRRLAELQEASVRPGVAQRPGFGDICETLDGISLP